MDPLSFFGIMVMTAGSISKGLAQEQQGRAAKSAADLNATIEEEAAGDAIERGRLKDEQAAMHGAAVEAEQSIMQSGGGADVNVGAPLATRRSSQAIVQIDRAIIRRNAAMEAYGFRGRARAIHQQGEYEQEAGENAMMGTFLGGMGNIAKAGGKFYVDQAGSGSGDSANIEE